jgi:protoheme IX farnesyltransferase
MDHEKPELQPHAQRVAVPDQPIHNPRRGIPAITPFKAYYRLTKPGIIYGNLLTTAGAFLLASKWHIDFSLFLGVLAGTALVIASACVFNNYIDRGIDEKMARTSKRAIVTGKINGRGAITYASLLGVLGFSTLILFTNSLVVVIGLVAFFDYIVLYGITKRRSVHGTLVGTIAGSAPPVAGYCAVTDHFDSGALVIFLIMVCWQMVHFYAIAIRRSKDYKAAKIPVMPLVKGIESTKIQMLLYTAAFIASVIALSLLGYTGYTFAVVMAALGLVWLWKGLKSFKIKDNVAWAKHMFLFSLIVLLSFSVMMTVGSVLP